MLSVPVDPLHEVAPIAELHNDKQLSRRAWDLAASVDGVEDPHYVGIVKLCLNLHLMEKK